MVLIRLPAVARSGRRQWDSSHPQFSEPADVEAGEETEALHFSRLNVDELVKGMFDAAARTDRVAVKTVSPGQRYTSLTDLELEDGTCYFITRLTVWA